MKYLIITLLAATISTNALAQTDNLNPVSRYVIEKLNVDTKSMRMDETQANLKDTTTIILSVEYNANGAVNDVKVTKSINELFDESFRSIILLMPKGIYKQPEVGKKSYQTLIFNIILDEQQDKNVSRDVELYFKRKKFAKVKTQSPEFQLMFPQIIEQYKSTPQTNSTLWLIRYRLMNLRVTAQN